MWTGPAHSRRCGSRCVVAFGLPGRGQAVSFEAGQGWGVTEEFLRASFAEPEWVDTEVEEIDVAAEIGGRELSLAGYLLRTVRAFDTRG